MTRTLAVTIGARQMWTRTTLVLPDCMLSIPGACVDELDAALRRWPAERWPEAMPSPAEFKLTASAALMDAAREILVCGSGMAILDRLPVERYSPAERRVVGWLLASLLGPVVAQTRDGARVYDVKDSGRELGYGVRRSVTNLEQPFHTDGGWLPWTPAFVGLLCLEPAEVGGMSRLVSLATAHERLRARAPHFLERLYRPFWWDRQAEHPPDEPRVSARAIFTDDGGELAVRYYEDYVLKGQTLAGEALDADGAAALAALRAVVEDPDSWVEFRIEKGQFQYLNNRRVAHSRTGFTDVPGARPRHMLRFWNRDEGTPDLEGI